MLRFKVLHRKGGKCFFAEPAGSLQALGIGLLCHGGNARHTMAGESHLLANGKATIRHLQFFDADFNQLQNLIERKRSWVFRQCIEIHS